MRPRRAALLAPLGLPLLLAACSTTRAARHFSPASQLQREEALAAVVAAQERAASLTASRLLYDARMNPGKGPAVPGTLAVTYDGREIARASLTGPFGRRVAEYDGGSVKGEDRQALVVDPGALRAVLSGAWLGMPSSVEGCDGDDCRVTWTPVDGDRLSVSAVVGRRAARLSCLVLEDDRARLVVIYEGDANPWPRRVTAREEKSGRALKLELVGQESEGGPAAAVSSPPR